MSAVTISYRNTKSYSTQIQNLGIYLVILLGRIETVKIGETTTVQKTSIQSEKTISNIIF